MTRTTTDTPPLAPLIKWPGGKRREFMEIHPDVPVRFDRYVEPFFGGGAVFFRLPAPRLAILNDANPDLMAFYRSVRSQDRVFLDHARSIAEDWSTLRDVATRSSRALGDTLRDFRRCAPTPAVILGTLPRSYAIDRHPRPDADHSVAASMSKAVANRLRRVAKLEIKHSVTFTTDDIRTHVETAIRSGYYTFVRDATPPDDTGARAAEFFFVREFCYGAMFRFNRAGRFNIPYGGIAYNKKAFDARVDALTSAPVVERLSRAELLCTDFADVLDEAGLTKRDFVFLDPPYDSDFSSYGNRSFALADHERLSDRLARLDASWILVIKKTEDVERIYGPLCVRSGATRREFDKSYTYNVRGRNDRNAIHLLFAKRSSS